MSRPLALRQLPGGEAGEPVAFEHCCYQVERLASLALVLEQVMEKQPEGGAVQILASGLLEQRDLLRRFMKLPDEPAAEGRADG
jgi:hypothetical protein